MKLKDNYNRALIDEFFTKISEEYLMTEGTSGLETLLEQANEAIFEKFKIQPSDRVYCITGSATLYLYPKLRDAFNLSSTIGDLDMVIPDARIWKRAGLLEDYKKGYYRPTEDIEAFTVWDPSKAGGAYATVKVRATDVIIKDAIYAQGHYFMALKDVVDYKLGMDRDKEKDITSLINQYNDSNETDKYVLLRKIVMAIGDMGKAREFLGKVKADKPK